jgi:hypothetical protein
MELRNNQSDKKSNNSSNLKTKSFKTLKSQSLGINALNISKENQNLINNLMRKYSYDPKIYIKNFVPVLRPKEKDLNLIPTKLMLNNKKRNSSTVSNPSSFDDDDEEDMDKDELNLSNSFVNSVESNSSSSNSDNTDNNEIKNARKSMTKIRKYSMIHQNSKKNIISKTSIINLDNQKNEKEESDSFLNYSLKKSDNVFEKNKISSKAKKSFNIISSLKNNEIIFSNNLQQKKRDRINSFSILETLQNKIKLDK